MDKPKKFYYKSSFFPDYWVLELLNKRDNWEFEDKLNEKMDFCWISGSYKICEDMKSCYKKYIKNICKNYSVRGDLPLYTGDYLLTKSLITLADKAGLYKKIRKIYGERDYLIKTFDVNINNIHKYKKIIEESENEFYLKPNEGGYREGQIQSGNYIKLTDNLKTYKKFKNWQLQEFVESFTKISSYIKVVSIVVFENNKLNYYISQKINYSGIINNKTQYIEGKKGTNEGKMLDNCYSAQKFNNKDYKEESGYADEIYDKLTEKTMFNSKILPKINSILKEQIKIIDFNKNSLNNKKLYFHLLSSDFIIDKNLKLKFLETNIQPEHFVSGHLICSDEKNVVKAFGGIKAYNKFIKDEKQLLDEILSITIDKKFPTKYKVKKEILKKII